MAAAYRVVVSSVSCYNSVVVDRRTHSHSVHYCSGPCGALSQGIDCTVAHCGTCSELFNVPDSAFINSNSLSSHNIITQQFANNGKITLNMASSYNGGLERASSNGSFSLGEDGPTWRGKKNPVVGGSVSNLSSSGSLKDITEEAINLASGKLKEFSFDKLRHSSSSHVTLRKGRKVRPDSFTRRSADLEIIYGHFSPHSTTNGTTSGSTHDVSTPNDENLPPYMPGKGTILEDTKLKGSTGSLSTTKLSSGSTSSLTSIGSLDQSLNTVASLYLNTLGEENLISRLLEKTRAEAGPGGTGGEDIRACLDILLKCSEDLKKCTDIIKQCIRQKAGGESQEGGASPDSIYKAVMTRLSSYLKRLPLELEGVGSLGGMVQGAPGSGHSDLAEIVNTLHSIQQGPYSPIFGNEQPPRYEDVVLSPPLSKTSPTSSSCGLSSNLPSFSFSKSDSIHSNPPQSLPTRTTPLTNGLQHSPPCSLAPHTLAPPVIPSPRSSPTQSPSPFCTSPTPPYTQTPPASPMEALYIEEEEADIDKTSDQISQHMYSPTKVPTNQNKGGTVVGQPMNLSNSHTFSNSSSFPASSVSNPSWAPKVASHRNDDIDKLLMDLENLSQSKAIQKISFQLILKIRPPITRKCPKRSPRSFRNQRTHPVLNGPTSRVHVQSPTRPKNSEAVVGEEEDGALLLRILESIESFAQELVDCGAGSTGSAERNSGKEREVMRLLQDTLATTDPVAVPVVETTDDATDATALDSGSTLLIQQTPEVIRGLCVSAPAMMIKETSLRGDPDLRGELAFLARGPPPPAVNIPRFYYPCGLPVANHEAAIAAVETAFKEFEEEKADIYEMGKIAKACGCPLYWKAPMFFSAGGERTGFVSVHSFVATWRKLLHSCHDDSSRFIYLLAKPGCSYLEQEDLIPLLQDIVDTHPGLTFLKDAPEFHSRYITTVIQRIFYVVNRSWTGRITMTELRRSNFLQTLALLEEEDDINQITDYFSYEHFYVIYCKFWELDTDHDLYIDPKDLSRYNDHASSNRIIERLFSGAVTRGNAVQREGRMSYAEFVWFLISEEDKKNPTSIEYWFRCMDTDGDGVLSMFELEYFYEEQCERMERMGIEPLPFQDLLCQMLDLVKPENQGKITLGDLKRCRMAHIFFDTFFNLEKYLDHEQRDPFAVQKDIDSEGPEPSDWDKYASEEYEILVAEETANEQLHEG
ncbi:unnamed protein product, partial [Tetraodon nigroviridis]